MWNEVEVLLKEYGADALNFIGNGLSDFVGTIDLPSVEGFMPYIAGVLALVIIVHILSLPLKLVWNGIAGAVLLWLVNLIGGLFGVTIKITIINALIAGFFGIPGVLGIFLWKIFM